MKLSSHQQGFESQSSIKMDSNIYKIKSLIEDL